MVVRVLKLLLKDVEFSRMMSIAVIRPIISSTLKITRMLSVIGQINLSYKVSTI